MVMVHQVRVLSVNAEEGKLSLSMKAFTASDDELNRSLECMLSDSLSLSLSLSLYIYIYIYICIYIYIYIPSAENGTRALALLLLFNIPHMRPELSWWNVCPTPKSDVCMYTCACFDTHF